jgi:23S rRNA (cytidine1920-2'-O)/16S rRNA (cytidine1409-2'-O)-methyltransferase
MRADKFLVENGFFETRAKAQAAIEAGGVRVNGVVLSKSSQKISKSDDIQAIAAHPYVSRAALKLVAGLDHFDVEVRGKVCLDVGASTGGFTQVLLERGASHVFAVDVGRDQLHASLRSDPRVTFFEGLDARKLDQKLIDHAPSLIVCDASFIGLEKVLETPLSLAADHAFLVALFKPQFEVGPAYIGKGGLVRPDAPVQEMKEKAHAFLAWAGFQVISEINSPIAGGDGNREFLIGAEKRAS